MKSRAEKIEKFIFKMNFGLDSGACRDAGASHSLCLNELFQRAGSVPEANCSVISGMSVSSATRRATISTAVKADDLAGRDGQTTKILERPLGVVIRNKV